MGQYTQEMKAKLEESALRDLLQDTDTFEERMVSKEDLLRVFPKFRSFPEALADYFKARGWIQEEESNPIEKMKPILHAKYKEKKMPKTRDLLERENGIERSTALKLCLALGLSVEEANDFLQHVVFQHPLYPRNKIDVIFYAAYRLNLDYSDIEALLQAEEPSFRRNPSTGLETELKKERDAAGLDTGYQLGTQKTSQMKVHMETMESIEDLQAYLNQNQENFISWYQTACTNLMEIWRDVRQEAHEEYDYESLEEEPPILLENGQETNNLWQILLQIYGLDYHTHKSRKNRTVLAELKEGTVPRALYENFPDRNKIGKFFHNKSIELDSLRKALILFYFYKFFVNAGGEEYWLPGEPEPEEQSGAFVDELNTYLLESGMMPLYEGDAYDWLFLYFSKSEDPLEDFRQWMRIMTAKNQQEKPADTIAS